MAVAGGGVLNTVVLQIRERVHDIGVFKAVGMTPRQTTVMVVCSVAGIGLVAGLIAIPAGIVLHHYVLPVMGHAAQTAVPASVLNVYHPWELVLLALALLGHRGGRDRPPRAGRPGPAPRSRCAPSNPASDAGASASDVGAQLAAPVLLRVVPVSLRVVPVPC